MTLSLRGDVFSGAAGTSYTFRGACASGTSIYAVTSEPKFRSVYVAPTTLTIAASLTLTGSNPSDITLIAPGSCAVSYQSSSQTDIIDVNTLNKTAISTNALSTSQGFSQQIAGNISTGLAIATSSTTGKVVLVTNGAATCTQLSPGALSGQTARCVITKPDTNTWVIGTSNGKIHEINSSGTVLTTVDVPSSPFATGGPTINIQGLSYCSTTSAILAVTDSGLGFTYNWTTGALTNTLLVADGAPILCNSASGLCLYAKNEATNSGGQPISEIYFENLNNTTIDSTLFNETNSGILSVGLEPVLNYGWAAFNSASFLQLRVFNITPLNKVNVNTRSQDPAGTDIATRILRIRDNGPGKSSIELDQNVASGSVALSSTNAHNYIELSIEGGGSPTKWDIREMQA